MKVFEVDNKDNIGAYTRGQTVVGGLKLWKVLMLALVRLFVFTTQKKNELQLKI
jgi:hypothetical protein